MCVFVCSMCVVTVPIHILISPRVVFEKILSTFPVYPPELDTQARDLISKLIIPDPEIRLGGRGGAEELQRHSFFADLDWQKLFARAIPPPMGLYSPVVPPPQVFEEI